MVVRQYDSGFTIRVTVNENAVPVDISTADPIALVFRPPGAAGDRSVTPTFATDGTDGILDYVVAPGLLDRPGNWSVFVRLEYPSGLIVRGQAIALTVEAAPA
jgi:hypothetical protein